MVIGDFFNQFCIQWKNNFGWRGHHHSVDLYTSTTPENFQNIMFKLFLCVRHADLSISCLKMHCMASFIRKSLRWDTKCTDFQRITHICQCRKPCLYHLWCKRFGSPTWTCPGSAGTALPPILARRRRSRSDISPRSSSCRTAWPGRREWAGRSKTKHRPPGIGWVPVVWVQTWKMEPYISLQDDPLSLFFLSLLLLLVVPSTPARTNREADRGLGV